MPKKRIDDTCLPQEKSLYSREEKCPILYTLDIIGGKWKLPIIWALAKQKEVRYNALRRSVVGISNMMLTKCLRELEENGIVQRMQYPEIPPRVGYSLTARGSGTSALAEQSLRMGQETDRIHRPSAGRVAAPHAKNHAGISGHSPNIPTFSSGGVYSLPSSLLIPPCCSEYCRWRGAASHTKAMDFGKQQSYHASFCSLNAKQQGFFSSVARACSFPGSGLKRPKQGPTPVAPNCHKEMT